MQRSWEETYSRWTFVQLRLLRNQRWALCRDDRHKRWITIIRVRAPLSCRLNRSRSSSSVSTTTLTTWCMELLNNRTCRPRILLSPTKISSSILWAIQIDSIIIQAVIWQLESKPTILTRQRRALQANQISTLSRGLQTQSRRRLQKHVRLPLITTKRQQVEAKVWFHQHLSRIRWVRACTRTAV